MSLIHIGKKKDEEKKTAPCSRSCGCPTSEESAAANACCPEAKDGICCVKVLGAGCKSCREGHKFYIHRKKEGIRVLRFPLPPP